MKFPFFGSALIRGAAKSATTTVVGSYGLCLFGPNMEPGKPFDYMAGAGVSAFEEIPEDLIAETFPGGLYCVVQRRGMIDEIGKAFQYVHGSWLPNSEYEYGPGVEFRIRMEILSWFVKGRRWFMDT
jgi:predicted transcriptional regulator YdeE